MIESASPGTESPAYVPTPKAPLVDFLESEKQTEDTLAPMPVWVSVLVIILSLTAGGWILRWYVGTGMLQPETRIVDEHPPEMATARGGYTGPAVRQAPNGATIIHCPECELTIAFNTKRPPYIRSIVYNGYPFVPVEVQRTRADARRIINDGTTQKYLAMTAEQLNALRASITPITMATTPADLDRLLALYNAYGSAKDKPAALTALQTAMTDVARRCVAPTRTLALNQNNKIRAILSSQQWSKFETMGR